MEVTAMRCGYVRVSSDEQAESGLGLAAQRQRIDAYCQMKGLRLAEVFEDPGVLGGKALGTRPGGARLLAEARRSKPVVIVARLDRLFRSVADAAQTIVDFDRLGIELVHLGRLRHDQPVWPRDGPDDERVRRAGAGHDPRTHACRHEGQARATRTDQRTCAIRLGLPAGRQARRNRKERKAIAWIQQLHADGTSLRKIAERLNERGIRPKRAEKWLHSSVLRIVSRPG
jgi:DNA invertase Pin-like site-specific DNA recombinase